MSQFIKFYFTYSMFNMFRTLIHPSSGACDFSIVSPHWLCVLVSMCLAVSVWLVGVVSVWQYSACHTDTSSTSRPHFTPGKDPVPIVQEAGWAPGRVWTGGKSRPHRDSIPDRVARSQTLYRLSYPVHKYPSRYVNC